MSLVEQLGDNNKNLPDILARYESYLTDVETNLSIKGKRLEAANLEQASYMAYYDQKRIELYTLLKYMEAEVDRVRGKLWKQYTENMSIALQTRDKDQYINNEQAYLIMNQVYLEVNETYKKFESVVEAFKARGFALRNITNLRVHALEDVAI